MQKNKISKFENKFICYNSHISPVDRWAPHALPHIHLTPVNRIVYLVRVSSARDDDLRRYGRSEAAGVRLLAVRTVRAAQIGAVIVAIAGHVGGQLRSRAGRH